MMKASSASLILKDLLVAIQIVMTAMHRSRKMSANSSEIVRTNPDLSKEDYTLAYKLQRRIVLKKLRSQELGKLRTSLKAAMDNIIE